MNERFDVVPLFSKPIYLKALDLDIKKIMSIAEKETYRECWEDDSDNEFSFGYQSTNLYVLEKKELKFLKDAMMKEFYLYNSSVMHFSNKFEITTSWFTEHKKGQLSNGHNHNNYTSERTRENCFRRLYTN